MSPVSRGPDADASLGPYVRAVSSHAVLFVLVTLATLAGAAALLSARSPNYEATAELLVTPLQQDDRTFLGIQLLRDSGDPTRTVQTAAALIGSPIAATRTAQQLGGGQTRQSVEDAVKVEPLGESNIVGVTADASSSGAAARLANAYAANALLVRAEVLRGQVGDAIRPLSFPGRGGPLSPEDAARLAELRAVRDRGDPTLSLSQAAQPPRSPTGAPSWLVLVLALVAGLTLGAIVAVLAERLDRRVRDIGELFALAAIPVLARVPTVGRSKRGKRGWPALKVPPLVRESFRTLQMQIDQRRADDGHDGRTIVVTSPSSGDGKTTTAVCLALALVAAGHEVILLDCDLRRPDIASRLGLDASTNLVTLLSTPATLDELLVRIDEFPALRVLPAVGGIADGANIELLTRRAGDIVAEARSLADYVVVDTAPLGVVSDALALTPHADDVLLVGRPHNSDRRAVETATALLERAHTPPTGWVVVGADGARRRDAYYYAGSDAVAHQRRRRPRSPVG
jgi:capsular exopolysaccharide synthesis family protein